MNDERDPVFERLNRRRAIQVGIGAATLLWSHATPASLAAMNRYSGRQAIDGYAVPCMLLDAADLAAVRAGAPPTLVGYMPADEFDRDRIPGSVQADWPAFELDDTDESAIEDWRRRVTQELAMLGIAAERKTIVYDAGTLFAARLWWVLHYLGYTNVQVINGGLPAWRELAGDAPDATPEVFVDADASPVPVEPRTSVLAPFDTVLTGVGSADTVFVDARTASEYADGHIPGAVNINYPVNALADPPRYWKPVDQLLELYESMGVSRDKRIIPYCSSGVRSAVTFFTLRLIGYENVALYTGSWNEWSRNPDAPVTTGAEP